MVVIVNYGLGNLRSVLMKFHRLKIEARISDSPEDVARADKLVLPGVGSFGAGMKNLRERGLVEALRHAVLARGVPILGICLGMQLFTERSEEGEGAGLGFIQGATRRFDFSRTPEKLRIPHIGWNKVERRGDSVLFTDIDPALRYYFVHSYAVFPDRPADVAAWCDYGQRFAAAVEQGNVRGVQFHPEKSHHHGLQMLKNFAECA
ncbi:Imidazole glycerol phosphate synthase subunit HisH [Fundidesulfovibrio magnetotacticus]|uniref:Imidazole glycerol phosphate synthase subunit HisH n=1 Tax=Fundidesulfovibrio magnetotacticus TaxID=2730080 RepID=A0A6V8LX05_9BACT|nr:imidazole glycerol phosphate synthase subunit HisH [Fundidesulfovibrio magnetotacticus]GFK94187.1 Imidazole glycerol phosphate synthase subunit HisH [Fundidesulfovibrio magnetotacticus]